MIVHSNKCLILVDDVCTCGAEREPVMTAAPASRARCTGGYSCKAELHWIDCYSQDQCLDPECEADKPHMGHR